MEESSQIWVIQRKGNKNNLLWILKSKYNTTRLLGCVSKVATLYTAILDKKKLLIVFGFFLVFLFFCFWKYTLSTTLDTIPNKSKELNAVKL